MKLKITASTDTGTARPSNEDYYGAFEEEKLVVICDGMGGHNGGAYASRVAVETLREMYFNLNSDFFQKITKDLVSKNLGIASRLIGSIRLANRKLYNLSLENSELHGMGTTLSALAISNGLAIIGHVGDSRIYRIRKDRMELLTEDHTFLNELILDKEIDPLEAKKFKNRNIITRALGLNRTVKIDLRIEPVEKGDIFLLCTDGLTKALSNNEIERIVLFNKNNYEHTIKHLFDDANIKDGTDNITIAFMIIEKFEQPQNNSRSTYVTLKAENERTSRLENKILKPELSLQSTTKRIINRFTKIFKKGGPN